jgi:NDP-sugar pyrophosphorylase family protein
MRSAFLLGAGLGTRLRPLTENLPKPLLPLGSQPLAAWALDHLAAAGIERCVINTHHCPEAWKRAFPDGRHNTMELTFRYEPVLLETGGGLKNVEDWLEGEDDLLVYNGDAWTDLPLERLLAAHWASGRAVTLGLRSSGGPLQVQAADGAVEDIRGALGGSQAQSYLFTGVYVVAKRVFNWFKFGEVVSVIPVFLDRMRQGEKIGGVVLDEGRWLDLGTRETYLQAHRWLAGGYIPSYRSGTHSVEGLISPLADISPEVTQRGFLAAGAHVRVEAGVELEDCVLWPGAHIERGSILRRCIVRENRTVSGHWSDHDF